MTEVTLLVTSCDVVRHAATVDDITSTSGDLDGQAGELLDLDEAAAGGDLDGLDGGGVVQVVTLDRRTSGLRPFRAGDPRAIEAGRKGAATRRARAAAKRADGLAVLDAVRSLAARGERADLGPAAVAAALEMIGRVSSGDQRVPDPAAWVRVLVDVARLEAGEATSASVVAHVGSDAAARVLDLQRRARVALGSSSSSALAADDVDTSGGVVDVDEHEHDAPPAGERGV